MVAVHVIDDSFVQPQPGTDAGDHLLSGLLPVGILIVVAWLYPRLGAGARAGVSVTFGALAVAVGAPAVYYLRAGEAADAHYTGLLAIPMGVLMLGVGPVVLWRARHVGGSRAHRYRRRSLTALVIVTVAAPTFFFFVLPVAVAYIYTHTGRTITTPDLGVDFQVVTVTTSDSLQLVGWYVGSRNGAAVIVYPGAARTDEARMLIDHGYGVLLLEARGQGASEGDAVRWAGDRDLLAGVVFLQGRPDVDPARIGALGFSVGGELLIEAAAQSTALRAVVSEGAGERVGEQDVSGLARVLVDPAQAVLTAATTVFSNHRPPPPIIDRIGQIAPRLVLLVYADPGISGENTRQPKYFAAAGKPKEIWKVPGSVHTGGFDAQPVEYERRVVGFFDRALRGDTRNPSHAVTRKPPAGAPAALRQWIRPISSRSRDEVTRGRQAEPATANRLGRR